MDTYAVQHPGTSSRQAAINSVGVHLTALCLVFETGVSAEQMTRLMGRLSKGRRFEFHALAPPDQRYPLTVVDLVDIASPDEYNAQVLEWAKSTWGTWSGHHDQVRMWVGLTLQQIAKSP